MADPLLNAAELARYLNVDVESVRRWAREGKIPTKVRLPGQRRHLRFDLRDVLTALGEEAPKPKPTERALDIEAHINASRERARRFLEGA